MKRYLCLLCLMFPCLAFADGGVGDVKKSIEASMVVTGSIVVAPDGSVNSYTLDKQEKLPSGVVELIGKTVPTWKFQPVMIDGNPVAAKAAMSMRVVATPSGNGGYSISVHGASFGTDAPGESIGLKNAYRPSYPLAAVKDGVRGTVYVDVLVDRQGKAENVDAEQVNLRVIGDGLEMGRWRKLLSQATLATARDWTFKIPQAGDQAKADHWVVRVPVNFDFDGTNPPGYGQWDAYVPGPAHRAPWAESKTASKNGTDAIPDGVAFQDDQRFVLLNPPGNG